MSTRRETVRIACGQGFWGDMLDAPVRQVNEGPIDYLMLDYLAEVTMSIMQDRKSTRLNSSHRCISYAVFCLKKKTLAKPGVVLDEVTALQWERTARDAKYANSE